MPEARTRHTPPGVLLKARPLPRQLEDRIADPMPDGIELYVHEDDVSGEPGDDRWRDSLRSRFDAITPRLTPGFSWIVEGPVWSLDGELFGLGGNRAIDRLLVERLVTLANDIGAWAVNIHAVDGSPDPLVVSDDARNHAIDRAIPFLDWYVRICQDTGITPLIENVPPICRMRRGAFIFTPHGVEPGDLLALCNAVPGLRLTVDTSHAQLAVNALRGVPPPEGSPESVALAGAVYRQRGEAGGPLTLMEFVTPLLGVTASVHVSNAAGLLDEGLPYDQGDADLDEIVRYLAPYVRTFVTEPLDSDEDNAVEKRRMQGSLNRCLGKDPW